MNFSAWFRLALPLALTVPCPVHAGDCPTPSKAFKTNNGGGKSALKIENEAGVPLAAYWIDGSGNINEGSVHFIDTDSNSIINSFVGHAFRIFADTEERQLLVEYAVQRPGEDRVTVVPCGGMRARDPVGDGGQAFVSPRAAEMEALVHDPAAPCAPAGSSSRWSCLRHLNKEEYEERLAKSPQYGFSSDAESQGRGAGATVDSGYTSHIDKIPRVANGSGYLKMSFTQKLRDTLLPWYEKKRKGGPEDEVQRHEIIPGGYTNINNVSMSKIDLDKHRRIYKAIYSELQAMLEWWTGTRLKHTSTFGVRIYHRDSMLINHVDRADTHLASAVIQVDQDVDEDGGWPLEVLGPDGACTEVYLQPGELVLYEGARFRHGRPMRLQGEYFANIFSHFAPRDWHGPQKSPAYDGRLDEHGYRRQHDEL